jgi:NAD-dependent SIR2 family protein deacetylase
VENHDIVKSLKNSITSKLEVSGGLIPKCPLCGDYLVPCLRVDSNFVEEPFMKNKQAYLDFVNFHLDKKLVLLELGVGFNTPVIIKYPFEDLANTFSNISLVRVNIDHTKPRSNRNSNIIELKQDLNLFVKELE